MTFEAFLLWSAAFQMFFPVPLGNLCPLGASDLGAIEVSTVNMCPIGTTDLGQVDTFNANTCPIETAATTAPTQTIQQPPAGSSSSATTGSANVQATAGSTTTVRDLLARSRSTPCTADT
jgi:hypothetical protein